MSHKISVINNAVSKFDRKFGISLVDKFEKNNELIVFKDNPDVLVCPETSDVISFMRKYSELAKKSHKENSGFAKDIYTTESYLSLWLPEAYSGVHSDSHAGLEFVMFSTVVYLNDDYEGGEIYFPNQDVEIKPSAGDMVIFPGGGHEYMHGVKPVISGRRYTIAMWHTMYLDYSPFDNPTQVSEYYRKTHLLYKDEEF